MSIMLVNGLTNLFISLGKISDAIDDEHSNIGADTLITCKV